MIIRGLISPEALKLLKYLSLLMSNNMHYRNDVKFSDSWVWANSADPDQTAPRGV